MQTSGIGTIGEENCYTSPPQRCSLFVRHYPSLVFYPLLARLIFKTSVLAKQGRLTQEALVSSCRAVFRLCESVRIRFQIENISAIRDLKSPCVIVSNHMSTLETLILPYILSPNLQTTFVIKDSLLRYPFFGSILKALNPIAVGRRNPRNDLKQMLVFGKERLESGISLVVFPQTSRQSHIARDSFNSIGIKLGERNKVPVVPLALKTDTWDQGKILKDIGRIRPEREVRMCFADPILVKDRGRDKHTAIIDFILQKLKEWERPNGNY